MKEYKSWEEARADSPLGQLEKFHEAVNTFTKAIHDDKIALGVIGGLMLAFFPPLIFYKPFKRWIFA